MKTGLRKLLALAALACANEAAAATRYVDAAGTNPVPPFATWSTAATNIQDAVNTAVDGEEVVVSNGTYRLGTQITVTNGIVLRGLGDPAAVIVDGQNLTRCIRVSHSNAVLRALTLARGRVASGGHPERCGGGVLLYQGGVVSNCIVSGCYAVSRGGGIYGYRGGAIRNCQVASNTASDAGAGVACEETGLVADCEVRDNVASGVWGGGGVWLQGDCELRGSRVTGNRAPTATGGGIVCTLGARVLNCAVMSNSAVYAAGLSLGDAVVRNCVVAGNAASNTGGGISASTGALIENCTIVGNRAAEGSGLLCSGAVTARNCIVYHNTGDPYRNWRSGSWGTPPVFSHLCTTPAAPGAGHRLAPPEFRSLDGGDFRLLPGSPCVNAGTNQPWMAGAVDLEGLPRLTGGAVDLGAYELSPALGPLVCNAAADPRSGSPPLNAAFTAHVAGSNTAGLSYRWDFDGDGLADPPATPTAAHTYSTAGTYTVSLTVSNALGQSATVTKHAWVHVGPAVAYVAPGGAHVFPYASWGQAATSLPHAVAAVADGGSVLVSNGTYALASALILDRPLELRGIPGGDRPVLDAQRRDRCALLAHPQASLRNLGFTRGGALSAGAVLAWGGSISNCLFIDNRATNEAGAVFAEGTLVSDCQFVSNAVQGSTAFDRFGGALYADAGARISGCAFYSNYVNALDRDAWGGAVYCRDAAVSNCTFWRNFAHALDDDGYGGALAAEAGALISHCTMVSNWCQTWGSSDDAYGGGMYLEDGAQARHCTLTGNWARSNDEECNGGGVAMDKSVLTDSVVAGSSAAAGDSNVRGGGLWADESTVANCTIVSNQAVSLSASADGGGLYCTWQSAVSGCVIAHNTVRAEDGEGGGLHCSLSTATECRVENNAVTGTDTAEGGGVYVSAALLRSSLVAGNGATNGGGVFANGSGVAVWNCTVVGNRAARGGGISASGSAFVNTLVFSNTAPDHFNVRHDAATFAHCVSEPLLPGPGNLNTPPNFMDPAADYRLRPRSPGVDAGLNDPWMSGVLDLDGHARILAGTVDIGAYELDAAAGPLRCNVAPDRREGFAPFAPVLTAGIAGAQTNSLYFRWDLNGDGAIDVQGYGRSVVTGAHAAGTYTVTLTVSNAAGAVAQVTLPALVRSGPATAYVRPAGSPAFPFDSWATAATSLHAAVAAGVDGTLVLVSNGTYRLASEVLLSDALTVRGVPSRTAVVDGLETTRCFRLTAPATLEGLTITRGLATHGAGVYIEYWGSVSNCLIATNRALTQGGGVYLEQGGGVTLCDVRANTAGSPGWNYGGGLYMLRTGVIDRCTVAANTNGGVYQSGGALLRSLIVSNTAAYGGGIFGSGLIRNCVIVHNTAAQDGGGLHMGSAGTLVESCTIAYNAAELNGGGVKLTDGASATNCVIYFNSARDNLNTLDGFYAHCCVTPLPAGTNNVDRDPEFRDPDRLDYTLRPGSPCLDAGTNQAWMAGDVDIAGRERILNGRTDIGAHEYRVGPLDCNAIGTPREGLNPLVVDFQAHVRGTNTTGLAYEWDFDNDGLTDLQGAGASFAAGTYVYSNASRYSVALEVRNAAAVSAAIVRSNYVHVAPAVAYVSSTGTAVAPYTSWRTAATNLAAAVREAWHGTVVNVNTGTYALADEIALDRGMTLRGAYGAAGTVVDGMNTTRCFLLTHSNALLADVTVTRGTNYQGGGVYLLAGTVSNCIVLRCRAENRGGGIYCSPGCAVYGSTLVSNVANQGGGLYCEGSSLVDGCLAEYNTGRLGGGFNNNGGRVRNSTARNNRADWPGAYEVGAGVALSGNGSFSNCLIEANVADDDGGGAYALYASGGGLFECTIRSNTGTYGGGVFMDGTTLRNCVIVDNVGNRGGGVRLSSSGLIQNCTIASNRASNYGGGLYNYKGTIRNTILYHNTVASGTESNYSSSGAFVFTNCILAPAIAGGTAVDPLLVDPAHGDFRLQPGSPCIDKGLAAAAPATDREGVPRPLDGNANGHAGYDIGAYEFLNGAADSDGDGLSDTNELRAGTGLVDPASYLGIMDVWLAPGIGATGLVVRWQSVTGKVYRLQRGTNLLDTPPCPVLVCTNIPAVPPMNTHTDTTAVGQGPWFYRIGLDER